jgi:spore cortex biosynthesis protein YabQ
MGYAAMFGVVLGMLYDLFRVLRLLMRPRPAVVFVQDLLFFSVTALLMSIFVFTFHSGSLRLYIFACAAAGAALWYMTFGRVFYRLWRRVAGKIRQDIADLSAPLRRIWAKFWQKTAEKRQKEREKRQKKSKKPFHFRRKHTIIEKSKYAYAQMERESRHDDQKT